jgi:peroxiredoxin
MTAPQPQPDPQPGPKPRPAAESTAQQVVKLVVALAALAGAGYYIYRQLQPVNPYQYDESKPMVFKDHAQSNVPLDGENLGRLQFVDTAGKPVDLGQYRGRSHVVLVVTRGNTTRSIPSGYDGNICVYCATQTSRLIANYKAIDERGAEVVVVFPIKQAADSGSLQKFEQSVQRDKVGEAPFPLVLDVELRAVDRLGIRADLAKPATYILDKDGQLRFAYVGATVADRPSVQSILEQLDAINAEPR